MDLDRVNRRFFRSGAHLNAGGLVIVSRYDDWVTSALFDKVAE
jgi:hypothetical protein